jgi:tetratricopeptide (TPR) repeat protein
MNTDDPARQQALETMLATAGAHRRRGQYEAAWRCLDDALAVAPQSAAVFEMMGLLNLDTEELEAAEQCFRRALEIEPGRNGSEVGLGRVSVELARRQPLTPELALAQVAALRAEERAIGVSALFSSCIPGLGQMRLLEFGRGAWVMAVAFVCWGVTYYGLRFAESKPVHRNEVFQTTPLFWLGLALTIGWHAWAASDTRRLGRDLLNESRQRL